MVSELHTAIKPKVIFASYNHKENGLNTRNNESLIQLENCATKRWNKEEHKLFLEGLEKYGRNWKKVSSYVRTRNATQTRSHAQKYFIKLNSNKLNEEAISQSEKGQIIEPKENGKKQNQNPTKSKKTEILEEIQQLEKYIQPTLIKYESSNEIQITTQNKISDRKSVV